MEVYEHFCWAVEVVFARAMSGEEVVETVVVAELVVEQEDEVVAPLVCSVVGPEDEREAARSALEGQVLEVAGSEVSAQAASG